MQPVTGIFRSTEAARRAYANLKAAGFSSEQINLLAPGASEEEIHSIPTSDSEQPGMGAAIGGVVGAAMGLAGGFELGTAIASMVVPGVGQVLAAGAAGAAVLGLGGAALGSAAEQSTTPGLPADEIFFYEDALRQGCSIVFVITDGGAEADRARQVLADSGAESLDAAREAWWIGLRDAEAEHYRSHGLDFEQDHEAYRAGFQAALRRDFRGKPFNQARAELRAHCPKWAASDAFRRGYERGQTYLQERQRGVSGSLWYGG